MPAWAYSRMYSVLSCPGPLGDITSTASAAVSPVSQVNSLAARNA